MAKCKHKNIVLKRICIFFLGVVIGLVAGHRYGIAKAKERFHDRLMKQAEKPRLNQRNKAPEPRGETFFEKKKRVPR